GVDDDVVEIAAGLEIELSTAGDETKLRVRRAAVHSLGGESVLRVLLDPNSGERHGGAIGSIYEDLIAARQVGQMDEDRRSLVRIHMSDDYRGPTFTGFRAVAPPAGAVIVGRRRQHPAAVDRQRIDRCVHPDRRNAKAYGIGGLIAGQIRLQITVLVRLLYGDRSRSGKGPSETRHFSGIDGPRLAPGGQHRDRQEQSGGHHEPARSTMTTRPPASGIGSPM